mmetsp:Transcript_45507/g.102143  ORF Transcript_45507/g.102143 Transcript_45507/m.102143 type:complete len:240 (+) Transcript_45507:662-1381(+)
MISSDHQDHLYELCAVGWELLPEPQKAQHATDADVLGKNIGDGDSSILQLVSTVIGDGRNEVGRLSHHAKLLCPCVVHWHLWCLCLHELNNFALLNQLGVQSADGLWQLVKGVWDNNAGGLHGSVLRSCCFHITSRLCTSVTELDRSLEVGCHSAHAPRNDWLRDATALDGLNDIVLINATNFAQEEQHLGPSIILVPCEMINEAAARVPVATNGDTLVNAIGVAANHVVQLIGHAARL